MLRQLVAAALVAAPFLAPNPASAQRSADEQAVIAVVHRLFDGMRAGDSSMVRSTFHPQLRMLTAMVREGKTVVRTDSRPDDFVRSVGTPRPQVLDEQVWNEKVQIDGPLASAWVDYSLFVGEKFSHCGIDHFLMVRDDAGAWKIIELADTRRTEGCERTTRGAGGR